MGRIYGYIRTNRRQTQGQSGSDPEAPVLQLRDAGVPSDLIYRDVGISGATGTNSRKAWRPLNARVSPGDVLIVAAVDQIGRRWMDTAQRPQGPARPQGSGPVPCSFGTALDALLVNRDEIGQVLRAKQ